MHHRHAHPGPDFEGRCWGHAAFAGVALRPPRFPMRHSEPQTPGPDQVQRPHPRPHTSSTGCYTILSHRTLAVCWPLYRAVGCMMAMLVAQCLTALFRRLDHPSRHTGLGSIAARSRNAAGWRGCLPDVLSPRTSSLSRCVPVHRLPDSSPARLDRERRAMPPRANPWCRCFDPGCCRRPPLKTLPRLQTIRGLPPGQNPGYTAPCGTARHGLTLFRPNFRGCFAMPDGYQPAFRHTHCIHRICPKALSRKG